MILIFEKKKYIYICLKPEPLENGPEIDIDLYALNNGTLESNVYKLVALPDGGAVIRVWYGNKSSIARVSPEGIIENHPMYQSSSTILGINYDEENGWAIPLHWNGISPVIPLEEPYEIVKTHQIPNVNLLFDCDVIPVSIKIITAYCIKKQINKYKYQKSLRYSFKVK